MFDGGDVVCMLCGKICMDWLEMNSEIKSLEDEIIKPQIN